MQSHVDDRVNNRIEQHGLALSDIILVISFSCYYQDMDETDSAMSQLELRIEQLETHQARGESFLHAIQQHWNGVGTNEVSDLVLALSSTWKETELLEPLAGRVQVLQRAIVKLISTFDCIAVYNCPDDARSSSEQEVLRLKQENVQLKRKNAAAELKVRKLENELTERDHQIGLLQNKISCLQSRLGESAEDGDESAQLHSAFGVMESNGSSVAVKIEWDNAENNDVVDSSPSEMPADYVLIPNGSQRLGDCIVDKRGYKFTLKQGRQSGKGKLWRCSVEKCKVRLVQLDDEISQAKDRLGHEVAHMHEPTADLLRFVQAQAHIRRLVQENQPYGSPKELLDLVLRDVYGNDAQSLPPGTLYKLRKLARMELAKARLPD